MTNLSKEPLAKGLALGFGLGVVVIAPSLLPKDPPQFNWNFTQSVERGVYRRIEERNVELRVFYNDPVYVSFCLPIELRTASFYDRFCSPDNPNQARILKRVTAKNASEAGGWVVRGDTEGRLDSRVLGPIQDDQIVGFWRPYITWGSADGE